MNSSKEVAATSQKKNNLLNDEHKQALLKVLNEPIEWREMTKEEELKYPPGWSYNPPGWSYTCQSPKKNISQIDID